MKRLALIAALAATTQLSGCWFIFIPGELIAKVSDSITGNEGDRCVPRSAKVGDKYKLPDGRIGEVLKLEGSTPRCNKSDFPIRAVVDVRYEPLFAPAKPASAASS